VEVHVRCYQKHQKVLTEFLLEWFLKSLIPYISKDIAISCVFMEEHAISKAQQLELIYSQFRMLYNIMPNAPRSTLNLSKLKSGPHANGIISSSQRKTTNLVSNKMQQFSIQKTAVGSASISTTPTTQSSYVNITQSNNQKGPKHPREKNKGKGRKGSGGNEKNPNKNVEGEKDEKIQVKFPCKICGDYHLTY
jgi:hypothetical protein